jgi:hypothetical protein
MINELLSMKTYSGLKKHYMVMWLYTLIIFLTSTMSHIYDKDNGFGRGMIMGFIISTVLWYQVGQYYV